MNQEPLITEVISLVNKRLRFMDDHEKKSFIEAVANEVDSIRESIVEDENQE